MATKKKQLSKEFLVVPSGEGVDDYTKMEQSFFVKDKDDFIKQLTDAGELPEPGDKPWTYDVYVLNSSINVEAAGVSVDDPDHILDGNNW